MRQLVSYSLSAFLLLSGCGSKPTTEKKPEVVNTTTENKTPKPEEKTSKPEEKSDPKKKETKKKPAPKEDKKLTSNERQQYQKYLNEGRTKHKAKDYKAAIAAFNKALELFPDDPRALSEKGWAEFADKDLAAAASDTNNAIGRTTNKDLLGSSYYNLGRIREDQQKTKEAIEAYQESLKVRPGNKIVQARLKSLNASLVEKGSLAGPFLDFSGPFATLADLCKPTTEKIDGEGQKSVCTPDAAEAYESEKSIKGTGKVQEAKVFAIRSGFVEEGQTEPSYTPDSFYYLAIQTAEGWFLLEESDYVYNPGMFGISESLEIETFEFKDVIPGGEPELLMVYTHKRYDSDMGINEVEHYEYTTLRVCGMGASQKMSCVSILLKEDAAREILFPEEEETFKKENPDFKHEGLFKALWSLDWSFTPDGKLQIKGTPNKDMTDGAKALIGTHTITFP